MKKVAIIASNGSIFDAYKVFNIATASAATDYEVTIFFTFDGINLINKSKINALPFPKGKEKLSKRMKTANFPTIPDLIEMAQDLGVKFVACQMTMDLYKIDKTSLVDDIQVGGAVTFIESANDAQVVLSF